MDTWLSIWDWLNLHLDAILTSGALLLSALSLKAARDSFREHNRPYLSCKIVVQKRYYIRIVISNHGARAAENIEVDIDPVFISFFRRRSSKEYQIEKISIPSLIPDAIYDDLLDLTTERNQNNTGDHESTYRIQVCYKYGNRHFKDEFYYDLERILEQYSLSDDIGIELGKISKQLEIISKNICSNR